MAEWAAGIFWMAIAGILIFMLAWRVYRSAYTPVQLLFLFLDHCLCRFLWRAHVPGTLRLPQRRGAFLVCNHRSSVDPFFVQLALTRPAHWMVAREFCEHPAFRWFLIGICEVIPVRRGGIDTAATKRAIRYAEQGGVVGVFPEGRINLGEQFMLPGRPGVAMMALKAGVPIVPCYVEGSPYSGAPWSPFFLRARTRVRFGPPIDLAQFKDQQEEGRLSERITLFCLSEIARLADRPEFEPRLASRNWKPSADEVRAEIAALRRRQAENG